MNKNEQLLKEFTAYCEANPKERFWQALRNWNRTNFPKENFILTGELSVLDHPLWKNLTDTFYR